MAKMNEALIRVKKESGIKSNELIARGTKIDTSTVSLHFSGKRQINVEQAYLYADFFKVHIIKILDDYITQYPIVAYCTDKGTVRLRNEDEWEVVLAPNDTENDGDFCIYEKNSKTISWYNPQIKVEKKEAVNTYCYLKNFRECPLIGSNTTCSNDNYVGLVIKYLGKKTYKILNYQTLKHFTQKIDVCYPITKTSHLDFSKYYKVKALINQ